jgi:exodeoxyribonuclease-3
VRLATWNVNSIRARLPRVVGWLATQRPDVLCLQEIKCQDEQFPREPFEDLGYSIETFGQKTYNGVAILSRGGLEDVARGLPGDPGDTEARVMLATIGGLRVINAYVVNGREVGHEKYHYKLLWLARLAKLVEQQRAAGFEALAVVGDFNVTFDDRDIANPEAWHEQILCSTPERQALAGVVAAGVADSVRKFSQDKGPYTWWDFKTRGFERGDGLRIDHILLSPAALARCEGVTVDLEARRGPGPSDHAPVVATLGAGIG